MTHTKWIAGIAAGLTLLAAGSVRAADGYADCDLAGHTERLAAPDMHLRAGRLNAPALAKPYNLFRANEACAALAPDACSDPSPRRLRKGTKVWVAFEHGTAACVLYPSTTGLSDGWIDAKAVQPVTESLKMDDWIGDWQRTGQPENTFAGITVYSTADFIAEYKKQAQSQTPDDLFSELDYDPSTRPGLTATTVGVSGEAGTTFTDASGEQSASTGMFIGMSDIGGGALVYSNGYSCTIVALRDGKDLLVADGTGCAGSHAFFWGRYKRSR